MFDDEPVKKPLVHEVGMPIDTMSVDELTKRVEMLREEILRLERAIISRQQSRSQADQLFRL
jgi:uncharacterized small protein (DUF1192 family)